MHTVCRNWTIHLHLKLLLSMMEVQIKQQRFAACICCWLMFISVTAIVLSLVKQCCHIGWALGRTLCCKKIHASSLGWFPSEGDLCSCGVWKSRYNKSECFHCSLIIIYSMMPYGVMLQKCWHGITSWFPSEGDLCSCGVWKSRYNKPECFHRSLIIIYSMMPYGVMLQKCWHGITRQVGMDTAKHRCLFQYVPYCCYYAITYSYSVFIWLNIHCSSGSVAKIKVYITTTTTTIYGHYTG